MPPSPVLDYLSKSEKSLNRLILLSSIGKSLLWSAAGAGLLLLAAKMTGVAWAEVGLWAGLTLAGGALGIWIGNQRRLNMEETARWLDKKLLNHEAFSAALTCLKHPSPGIFDQKVLERAMTCIENTSKPEWPWKYSLRWLCTAMGVVIVFAILFQIHWSQFYANNNLRAVLKQTGQENILGAQGKSGDSHTFDHSPQALAEKLFPNNPRMAKQMEQALRQGDTVVLERLFKEAEWDTDHTNEREIAPAEPGKVEMEKQRMEREILAMARENGANRSRGTMGEQGGDGKTGREAGSNRRRLTEGKNSRTTQPSARNGNGNEQIPTERTGTEGKGGQRKNSKAEQGDKGKGQQAGKGSGNVNRYWGNLNGPSSQTRAVITQPKDGPMLEYVLPGKKVRAPLSQVVPHAQRTAEAAMAKEEVPGEYEMFVRSYFLKLTQKSSGKSRKGSQP